MKTLTRVKELLAYPLRRKRESEKQKTEGYSVEIPGESRGEYLVYREGERSLSAFIDISWWAGARLYTQTLTKWERPEKGKRLSQAEYDLVLRRISDYLSLQGEVILDDTPLLTHEEQLAALKEAGESEGFKTVKVGDEIKFVKDSSNS